MPSQSHEDKPKSSLATVTLRADEELVACIDVFQGKKSLGTIEAVLYLKYAPRSVRNFIKLAEKHFYDGTSFHRVQHDSFIQGGDPLSRDKNPKNDGTGGPGYTLPVEKSSKKHIRGALAMAAVGKRNSGSQFFIDLKEHPNWDGKYTVFGQVRKGLNIAAQIGKAPLHHEHPKTNYSMKIHVEKRTRQIKLY